MNQQKLLHKIWHFKNEGSCMTENYRNILNSSENLE